jgi:peptidoglycan/LPS O-acetylase OafA/YrhL
MNANISICAAEEHIRWLDGLRGLAALWVVLSHAQILSGMHYVRVLSWGGVAVDLFMMLSGFLMTHHYLRRRQREPWEHTRTIALFWTRRFFRIAPLYYALLAAALLCAPQLGDARSYIAAVWPGTGTETLRYADQSLTNLLVHLSFTFGLLPDYAFRTALPDWSIGLEMQFYAVFPLIMLLAQKIGPAAASLGLILACASLNLLFPAFLAQFAMPAFLPMKLPVFLVGMLMAFGRSNRNLQALLWVALIFPCLMLLQYRNMQAFAPIAIAVALFYLTDDGQLYGSTACRNARARIRQWLSGRLAVFLGTTSYSTYLLHLLVLLPIAGNLARHSEYLALNQYARFALVLAISLPVIYLGSCVLYIMIEAPGIDMGKTLIDLLQRKRNSTMVRESP